MNHDEDSDRRILPVYFSGGFVGNYYATGIVDFDNSEIYCLEHGLPLAEEVNNPDRFKFIKDTDETDYEQRCMMYIRSNDKNQPIFCSKPIETIIINY